MGLRATRPSPSEYFDLVSKSYADVAIFFSRVCKARAAAAFSAVSDGFWLGVFPARPIKLFAETFSGCKYKISTKLFLLETVIVLS